MTVLKDVLIGGLAGLFIAVVLMSIINSFPVWERSKVEQIKRQEVWTGVVDLETGTVRLVKDGPE